MGQLLHTEGQAGAARGRSGPHALRYAFFGGEPLTRRDVADLRELAPSAICVNYYGATETPQAMGYYVVEGQQGAIARDRAQVPIGEGIESVQLLVVNAAGKLAGVGELGEIHVRTPYLARGYLGDDVQTGRRFLADPFAASSDARVYRTGDLARYRPDGAVEYFGREDHQVKLRGFRIELEEVEGALCQHDDVARAAVVVREDVPGQKQLVAYVVPTPGREAERGRLERFLADRLPNHMVPSVFVTLEALPLTPNGKVDARALPLPGARLALGADANPRNAVEQVLAELWGEVLGCGQVGIFDNFFDLGGHSLLATQLVSRVRVAFDVDVPLRLLFQRPTVAGLASALLEGDGERWRIERNAEVLLRVAQLSDQEVEMMLGEDSPSAGGGAGE
jgi:hypothetical protein